MDYARSVKYLESFWKFGIKPGLQRIDRLLAKLGDPHKSLKCVHVAGTNGKGSVCAMTASVLREAGYKVGLYTSPHLMSYRERFKINGKDITEKKFSSYVSKIRKVLKSYKKNDGLPTEFEILTAVAFKYFADEKVDIAVIEAGLGGRLDSTNVITPLVSVITNVGLDHTEVLGNTIKKIAAEKAGIIKKGVPVVTAATGAALDMILTTIIRRGAIFCAPTTRRARVNLPLYGHHQQINAAVAVGVARELTRQGFGISEDHIRKGLKRTNWPARFQIIRKRPFLVIDGAHNPPGAEALKAALKKRFPSKKIILILGILSYKDHKMIVSILAPLAKLVIAARPDSRFALDPEVIAKEVKSRTNNVVVANNVKTALKTALSQAGGNDVVCVAGSLITAGSALRSA